MKLNQKHIVKGTREFELIEDGVHVKIDSPFLKKDLEVVFSSLDPEPVISGSSLVFNSVVSHEPLLEFFIDKPDAESFNAFVDIVKERITKEEFGKAGLQDTDRVVNVEQLQATIDMLSTYLGEEIAPFLASLEALKADPESNARFDDMCKAYDELGPSQGAVLTYATYISTLMTGGVPDYGGPDDDS